MNMGRTQYDRLATRLIHEDIAVALPVWSTKLSPSEVRTTKIRSDAGIWPMRDHPEVVNRHTSYRQIYR